MFEIFCEWQSNGRSGQIAGQTHLFRPSVGILVKWSDFEFFWFENWLSIIIYNHVAVPVLSTVLSSEFFSRDESPINLSSEHKIRALISCRIH